jgi:nucleotide-binding universal stress UspA family protein
MSTVMQDSPPTGVELGSLPAKARLNPALHGPVLLATDGTGKSGAPAIAAKLIAQRLGVPLEIVTVLEPQVIYGAALGGIPVYLPEVDEARKATRMADVSEFVTRYAEAPAAPPIHLRFGGVAEEIALVARERSATLVVVGAAPHQRLNHIVAGELAVRVLRESTAPVLSVPPGFSALPKSVVVAMDFSPASVRAAETALLLLTEGGTLTLLHVLSPLLADAPIRDVQGGDPSDTIQTLFGRVRDELRPFTPADVTIETRIRTDLNVDGILESAASVAADLVVVGTHGPRLLERIFVGSVASSIVHAAPQAVLAVPPPPAADALELWLRITGTATSTRAREWAEDLDAFTRRNKGRRAAIEVDDPEIGAQVLGRGGLVGVTYDRHDQRVEIVVGDAHRARSHLMHSIPHVESIAMTVDERTGSEALELRHGNGQTLVLVGP